MFIPANIDLVTKIALKKVNRKLINHLDEKKVARNEKRDALKAELAELTPSK